jgi:hypothetical protein
MTPHYVLDFLLEGQETKIKPKKTGADIIFYADGKGLTDRQAKKDEVEAILRDHKIEFESKMILTLTGSLESTVLLYKGYSFRFAYKPAKGGGAGAGAAQTDLAESAQAIYCAAVQVARSTQVDHQWIAMNIDKVQPFTDTTSSIEKVIEELDLSWQASCITTAAKLYSDMLRNQRLEFHRGSQQVTLIEKKFTEVNRKSANRFSNINKWSPADIYAFKKGFRVDVSKIESVQELNQYLLKNLLDHNIYPISLKKVGKHATIEKNNIGPRKSLNIKLAEMTPWASGKNLLSSKDVYITILKGNDAYKVQFRSFTPNKSWQGEIKGKHASHGKISHGGINKCLADMSVAQLPPQPTMGHKALKHDPKMIREVWDMAKQFGNPGLTEGQYNAQVKDRGTDWLYSIWYGLKLLTTLKKLPQNKQNKFAEEIFMTAKSGSSDSAPFIKVH